MVQMPETYAASGITTGLSRPTTALPGNDDTNADGGTHSTCRVSTERGRAPGGNGGIRTLDAGLGPHASLAGTCLQPLSHVSLIFKSQCRLQAALRIVNHLDRFDCPPIRAEMGGAQIGVQCLDSCETSVLAVQPVEKTKLIFGGV